MPTFFVKSLALQGINAYPVTVETDYSSGLPSFEIVGLAALAVKESSRRVRSAYGNAVGELKKGRVTVNLAPADVEKNSSALDLPVFVSLCGALGDIPALPEDTVLIGELSLSGEIKPVRGVIAYAASAAECGMRRIIVPQSNAGEAAIIPGIDVIGVSDVKTLISYLRNETVIEPTFREKRRGIVSQFPDFCEVKGQYMAKRALEIAAAGGHNIVLIGPPGSGKSMLAKRLPSILPPLSDEEAVEVTKIWSIAGVAEEKIIDRPPFRSPHHTVSSIGLSGGGGKPGPGEISLAHRGVLFLDEWPEFTKSALEILRQPIEDKKITVSRAVRSNTFPADFILVSAANPCKCGNYGSKRQCTCTPKERKNYMSHISGPLLDRMDLFVEVPAVTLSEINSKVAEEKSVDILKRVINAREIQGKRLEAYGIKLNSQMSHGMIEQLVRLTREARQLISNAFERYGLTARSYDRLLKTAQTVSDLSGSDVIDSDIIAEVLSYRTAEKKYFQRG